VTLAVPSRTKYSNRPVSDAARGDNRFNRTDPKLAVRCNIGSDPALNKAAPAVLTPINRTTLNATATRAQLEYDESRSYSASFAP
jgi:hypothetical protein